MGRQKSELGKALLALLKDALSIEKRCRHVF